MPTKIKFSSRDILKRATKLRRTMLLTHKKKRSVRYSNFGINKKIPLTIVKEEIIARDIYKGQLIPGGFGQNGKLTGI